MSVITILRQLLRKPDARDALYLALCVEGDCETVTHRSQIGQRHAPRLAGHLPVDGLGYFMQGCEALALVAPREMSRRPKGSWTGGSGATLGIREAPSPVAGDLEGLAHGHAAPNAETGPSG